MNATDANFAVVMPVYEDQEASTRLFRELFAEYGTRAYVVAVDDGSINQPVQIEALQSHESCALARPPDRPSSRHGLKDQLPIA
jgi:hypothetical protein